MRHLDLEKYQRYGEFILDRSEELGKGSYGTVYKGYRISAGHRLQSIAIKEAYIIEQIMKQIRTLEILEHPNIVKYYDYREYKNHILVFMELCSGGNLDNLLLKRPSAAELTRLYGQVLEGIKCMYLRNILHRDIKPSNILVKDNTLKIADFGTSKLSSAGEIYHQTLAGTPLFCSPEMLRVKIGQQKEYTEQSEIWSLGMLLYYMFNFAADAPPEERTKLSIPWFHKEDRKMLQAFSNQALVFRNKDVPQQIKEIIEKMLVVDPNKRMTFKELFRLEIFHNAENFDIQESERAEMTLQLTTINKIDIDEQLKDKLRQREEQDQSELLYTKVLRQKAVFLFTLWLKIFDMKTYPQLQAIIAKLSHDCYVEYLSLASSVLTCDKYRDTQNLRRLQKQYACIKLPQDRLEQSLLTTSSAFIESHPFLVDFHDQSKPTATQMDTLFTTYDLLVACTLSQHWKDRPRGIQEYYELRTKVRAKTLITRIQQGIAALWPKKQGV